MSGEVAAAASSASIDAAVEPAVVENDDPKQSHLMLLAELRFAFSARRAPDVQAQILALVQQHKMAPFYHTLCEQFGWPEDTALHAAMAAENATALAAADAKIADAEKNHGEVEVRDALLAKAELYANVGDVAAATTAYEVALKKTVGAGPRIDVVFSQLRVALFVGDVKAYDSLLKDAQKLIDEGGDWDRRNRLKMYRALHCMLVRDFKAASSMLMDGIATFSATELFPYSRFVLYVTLTSMLSVDRPTLATKVVRSPEIYGSLSEVPHLSTLLHSLHGCKYADFFPSLVALMDGVGAIDRFLAPHARYLQRELRLVAYQQFLVSYKAVQLVAMAAAFGISVDLLDSDLAQFISSGRLACKIDKVAGVVEATRADARNAQYAAVIKDGDALLNRVQKLSRVISY